MSAPCLRHPKWYKSSTRGAVITELKEMGLKCDRAQHAVKDQPFSKQIGEALHVCPTQEEGD